MPLYLHGYGFLVNSAEPFILFHPDEVNEVTLTLILDVPFVLRLYTARQ